MTELQEEVEPSVGVKRLYLLSQEQIDHYWHDIIEGLKACPHYFEYFTPEWTYWEVKNGRLLVWALSDGVIRGIVMTRILEYPKQKVFSILALYGAEMLTFFNEMEDVFLKMAQRFGCQSISAQCRPGLKRLLKKFHAEHEAVVLYRSVPQIGEH